MIDVGAGTGVLSFFAIQVTLEDASIMLFVFRQVQQRSMQSRPVRWLFTVKSLLEQMDLTTR